MADATVTLRQGETRPVYATVSLPGGSLLVTAQPTVRVYSGGLLKFTADVTDISGEPGETVQVIYTVDASDALLFPPGSYTLLFTIATVGSDALTRIFEPAVSVDVLDLRSGLHGFPTGEDLEGYITSLGIIDPDDLTTQLARMNCGAKAAAAQVEFEGRTGWQPFLDVGADVTRYFDPPGRDAGYRTNGGRVLALDAGLLSVTTLKVGVTLSFAGALLTENLDFRLGPYNARAEGLPFEYVEFGSAGNFWPSGIGPGRAPRSIAIAGRWGFTADMPADAFQALLQYGAYLCYPELALYISGGYYSQRELNSETRYGGGGVTTLSAESAAWKAGLDSQIKQLRRISLG